MLTACSLVALAVVLCAPARAEAQPVYPPIADRDYALDAYQGTAVASQRIVGMGGTSLATAEGAASMSSNPASVASRLATSNDWFDWDFAFDAYTPAIGTDFDNNGTDQKEDALGTQALNLALMGYFGAWGAGLSVVGESREIELASDEPAALSAAVVRFTVGRSFRDREITVGAGFALGTFDVTLDDEGGDPDTTLVEGTAGTLEAGVLWQPPRRNLRVGAAGQLPIRASLDQATCDPNDCGGYILPERVEFPWKLGAGVAWRRGPTPWNIRVHDDWRDEQSLVLAADLIVTGPVERGAGIEAFLDHRLQPSGRSPSLSVRTGAEYEWVPGWFRVRGGLYYEPGRFEGVGGRGHVTVGFDVRFWSFCFWDDRYRLRVSGAGDAARGYTNIVLSLGLWH